MTQLNGFKRLFSEYGLPASVLCDNGPPWGDCKPGAITLFDVWMMQLDVLPIHCRPLHPQTQGKAERFHRTVKDELLRRRLFEDLTAAQRAFDAFRYEYNFERPHNAIDLHTPSAHYRPSKRVFHEQLTEPEYDDGRDLRLVNYKGYLSIHSRRYFMSDSLIGKTLELKLLSDTEVGLYYGNFRVAKLDLDEQIFTSRRIYRRDAEK